MKIICIMFLCFVEVYIGQNQNCDYIYNPDQRYQCIVNSFSEQFYYDAFLKFKNTYKRNYNSFNEEQKRYSIFKRNYKKILKHNLDIKNQYYQNINRFTDLDENEFQQKFLAEEQRADQNQQKSFNYYYPTFYPEEESEDEIIDDMKEEQQTLVITPLIDQNLQQHLRKSDTNTKKQQNENIQIKKEQVLKDQDKESKINENEIDIVIQDDKNQQSVKKPDDKNQQPVKKPEDKNQKDKEIQLGSNFMVNQDQQQNNKANNIIQDTNNQKEVQNTNEKSVKIEQNQREEKKVTTVKRTKFYYKYNTKTKKIEKVYFN